MRIFHDADMAGQPGSGMNRFLQYCDKGIFEILEDTVNVVFMFAMPADGVIPNNPQSFNSSDAVPGKKF